VPTTVVNPTAAQADSEQASIGAGKWRRPKGRYEVKLYFVATGDNGKMGKLIGCGDSLVEVSRDIPRTGIAADGHAKICYFRSRITITGSRGYITACTHPI